MKSSAREIPPPSAAAAAAAPPVAPAPAASSSSTSPIPSLHESFLIVLNDSIGRRALFQFLESTYTEHHLAFWEAVQFEYKPIQTDSDRNTAAVQLWNRYVKTGTSQQINITEPQRLRLQTSIEKIGTIASTGGLPYSASCDLFDDAASTCLELLKGNYFFAFQQSKQFQTYQIEKKSREDEEKKKQLKHSKSSSTCTIL